jgi:hypothetical protein
MMGFAQKFFLAKEETALNQIIDAYSHVKKEKRGLDLALPRMWWMAVT